MNVEEIENSLSFLRDAEKLKDTLRTAHTSLGRQESTAEHSWRLCLMALVFGRCYPGLDLLKLLKICIVHDLGEAVNGDVPATNLAAGDDKAVNERRDLQLLTKNLPCEVRSEILQLWDEYDSAGSDEALLAKAFDKIETLLQHTQGKNPRNFNHEFNLAYGIKYTNRDPLTAQLRALIDDDTRRLLKNSAETPLECLPS